VASVVIPAHNEASVIGACLDALLEDAHPGEFDVTVVPNGCSDGTADVARGRTGVRVMEITTAGKPGALNVGDAAAVGFPRIYLDADVVVPTDLARTLCNVLDGPEAPLAAFPARVLDLSGSPLPVRCYFAINSRLPVFREGLFGRGVIAVSKRGRARFDTFPDLQADDLFLDSLFDLDEKCEVSSVHATVAVPRSTRDLVNRMVRVRRGNAVMRQQRAGVRESARWSWLHDVVLPRPWLAPAAVVYIALTLVAAAKANRSRDMSTWERDESTRAVPRT
jgi:glycosyltransferase involved in cell wall biosynthesis